MNSKISWTDHSYNPWRGCTKVGPGCDACYAEARDIRYESGKDATEGAHWGAGKPRIRATESTRNGPYKIVRKLREGKIKGRKIFAASLADIFDNEVPDEWRDDFWKVVRETPELLYQIVTKRIGNADKMLPPDFPNGYAHVGVIATMVNQPEIDRDLPKLIRLKRERCVTWIGASIEPQLGRVILPPGLDWAITGGESRQPGHIPRPYDLSWARLLIETQRLHGAAVFVKQTGAMPVGCEWPSDGMGKDPAEWPADIRVQDFPAALL